MDSSSFAENVLEWKWTDESTDALISNFHCALIKCGQRLVHFNHCYWLLGLSRLLIGGLPRTETSHPPINRIGGPLGEPGFCIFWQCCQLKKNPGHPGGTLGGPHKFWVVRHTNIKKWYMHILITTHPTWLHHLRRLDMDFGGRNSWVAVGPVFGIIWVAQSFHRSHWRPGDRLAVALVYHRVYSPLEPFHVLSVRNVHHLFFSISIDPLYLGWVQFFYVDVLGTEMITSVYDFCKFLWSQ